MYCLRCKNYSGKSLYCRECRKIKERAVSTVSQNKRKLKKLLGCEYVSQERLDRLNLYTTNINNYGLIVIQYKQEKSDHLFYRVVNSFTTIFVIISLYFAFELLLVN